MRGGAVLALLLLALPAQAGDAYIAIPVPAVTLYPGDIVTDARLASRRYRRDWVDTQPFARAPDQIAGLSARRMLAKGRPIPLDALGPADLVSEGDMVTVRFASGGLEIAARLMALDSGTAGSAVRLRNPETGRVVTGRITGAGVAEVTP